mmetsp:Transcript_9478/g.29504  ORF Transcript_9478/g.29504 Transcript_9478/m.29504 type:complete len:335 (-) Transcript_9478:26-1030(-)
MRRRVRLRRRRARGRARAEVLADLAAVPARNPAAAAGLGSHRDCGRGRTRPPRARFVGGGAVAVHVRRRPVVARPLRLRGDARGLALDAAARGPVVPLPDRFVGARHGRGPRARGAPRGVWRGHGEPRGRPGRLKRGPLRAAALGSRGHRVQPRGQGRLVRRSSVPRRERRDAAHAALQGRGRGPVLVVLPQGLRRPREDRGALPQEPRRHGPELVERRSQGGAAEDPRRRSAVPFREEEIPANPEPDDPEISRQVRPGRPHHLVGLRRAVEPLARVQGSEPVLRRHARDAAQARARRAGGLGQGRRDLQPPHGGGGGDARALGVPGDTACCCS